MRAKLSNPKFRAITLVLCAVLFGLVAQHGLVVIQKRIVASELHDSLSGLITDHRNGDVEVIDLSTITTFKWDRFYVYGPYAILSNIDARYGRAWRDTCSTAVSSYENLVILIFTKDNRAVQCIEYGRGNGDFADLDRNQTGFSMEEAIFELDDRGRIVRAGSENP